MRRRVLQWLNKGIIVYFDGELLCFTAGENCQFSFTNDVYYSTDLEEWELLPKNTYSPTISRGEKIWWYANLTPNLSNGIGTFSSTNRFNVSGNPRCLLVNNELADYAFSKLFYNCSKLTDASNLKLNDDVLVNYCYYMMFYNCSSLTQAPKLPATTLADYCYSSMFSYCKLLTTAPELPATNLASNCYNSMFSNCTSLTSAPELPAMNLAHCCYQSMFVNCTCLTEAPELLATTLTSFCYYYMFAGCSKLNKVICHATTNINETNLRYWLSGVSSKGKFYKVKNTGYTSGVSGIPTSWTRHDISPLKFTALEDGQFSFTNDIQYKIDDGEWLELKANEFTHDVKANSVVYWKGELEPNYLNGIGTFSSTGQFSVSGDPVQLLKDWELVDYAFSSLFYNCDKLIDASALILDIETLTPYCYSSMFMNCISLERAPELPATTLGIGCYSNMFNSCVNLINAPAINAPILADYCCNGMFSGCSSLKYVKSYATDISATNCLYNWLYGVSSIGNFSTSIGEQYPTGSSGIPDDWEIIEI